MEGFIFGDVFASDKLIKQTAQADSQSIENMVPNPEYHLWRQVDQVLLGWILSYISKEILTRVNKVFLAPISCQI